MIREQLYFYEETVSFHLKIIILRLITFGFIQMTLVPLKKKQTALAFRMFSVLCQLTHWSYVEVDRIEVEYVRCLVRSSSSLAMSLDLH